MPPSPPNSEAEDENFNSFYYLLFDDYTALYESTIIPDSKLPPILSTTAASQLSNSSVECKLNRVQEPKNRRFVNLNKSFTSAESSAFYIQKLNDKKNVNSLKHFRRQSGKFTNFLFF